MVLFNVGKRENNPECEKGGKVHHTKKRKQCQVAGSNKKFRKNIVRSDPQRRVQIQVQNLHIQIQKIQIQSGRNQEEDLKDHCPNQFLNMLSKTG